MRYLVLLVVLLKFPLMAQTTYELGGSFDPSTTPRFKGAASYLTPATLIDPSGNTLSYTTVLFNRAGTQFTYSITSGFRHKIPGVSLAGMTLYGEAQVGASLSGTATTFSFIGGGTVTHPIKGKWYYFVTGELFKSALTGGVGPQVQTGIGYQ